MVIFLVNAWFACELVFVQCLFHMRKIVFLYIIYVSSFIQIIQIHTLSMVEDLYANTFSPL